MTSDSNINDDLQLNSTSNANAMDECRNTVLTDHDELKAKMYQTENIVHWPCLRSASNLASVAKYYVFGFGDSTLMVMKTTTKDADDHRIYAFGSNPWGRLGVGQHTATVDHPTEIEELRGKNIAEFCGNDRVMALTTGGDLFGWGCNNHGQVGCGNKDNQIRPVLVKRGVLSVQCGFAHTVALDLDGAVWCWGCNDLGQLARSNMEDLLIPVRIEGLQSVESIKCGSNNCVALTRHKKIYIWGALQYPPLRIPTLVDLTSYLTTVNTLYSDFYQFWTLGHDGKVHRWWYGSGETLQSELIDVQERVQLVVSRPWIDVVCLVLGSGLVVVWHGPGHMTHTSLNSVPDAFALYGRYPVTPYLTTLPPSAINSKLLKSIDRFHTLSQFDLALVFPYQNTTEYYKPILLSRSKITQQSEYLKSMVNDKWKSETKIYITTYSYWVYWAYLYFMQTGNFKIELDWAQQLLSLAIEFGEKQLADRCRNFLIPHQQLFLSKAISQSQVTFTCNTAQLLHQTNNLNHWSLLSKISPVILSQVRKFYVFHENSALVLTHDSEVLAFGCNQYDMLGVGHRCLGDNEVNELIKVEELCGKTITCIVHGDSHVMALTSDGGLYGWGRNDYGQVGSGCAKLLAKRQTRPVLVRQAVKSVRCGMWHTATIDLDGAVWCWGRNHRGQLGRADAKDKLVIGCIEELPPVESIECGDDNCMALTKQGQIYLWGNFEPVIYYVPTKISLPSDLTAKALSPGWNHFWVLSQNDTVHRFYYALDRSLEHETIDLKEPVRSVISQLCDDIVCLVTSFGRIVVWHWSGAITHTSLTQVPDVFALYGRCASTPHLTTSLDSYLIHMEQSDKHYAEDNWQQTNDIVYWPLLRKVPKDLSNQVKQFFIFKENAFIFLYNHEAFGIGPNTYGMLGVGHQDEVCEFIKIDELSRENIIYIDYGYGHVMALTSDGNLYGWGRNDHGQVGCDSQETQNRPVLVKRDVISIRCGLWHNAAIDQNGMVWCWGCSGFAQQGRRSRHEHKLVPVCIKAFPLVTSIECGNNNYVALTIQGDVYLWGIFASVTYCVPTQFQLPSTLTVKSLSLGFNRFWILEHDGTLYRFEHGPCQALKHEKVELRESIRAVVARRWDDIVCLVTESRRVVVWHGPGDITHTSLTSVPDAFALYGRYPYTPQLTSLANRELLQMFKFFHNRCPRSEVKFTFPYKYVFDYRKPIYVCKETLQKRSPSFRAHFEGKMKDATEIQMNISFYWIYWTFLRFLFTGEFYVEDDWIAQLIQVAIEYNEDELLQRCHEHCLKLLLQNANNELSCLTDEPYSWENETEAYQTHDISHWLLLRFLPINWLETVNEFYIYADGEAMLMVTNDDRVYYVTFKQDWQREVWLGNTGVDWNMESYKRNGKILEVEWDGEILWTVTTDGDLYMLQQSGARFEVKLISQHVRSVKCGISLIIVLNTDGTLWYWIKSANTNSISLTRLEGVPVTHQVSSGWYYYVALTKHSMLYLWGQFGSVWHSGPTPLPLPPKLTITSVAPCKTSCLMVTQHDELYRCHYDQRRRFHCDRVEVGQPIRQVVSSPSFDIVCLIGKSSLITVWSEDTKNLIETSLNSVPDVCALYGSLPVTPTLTKLSTKALQGYQFLASFNNPLQNDFHLKVFPSRFHQTHKTIYINASLARLKSNYFKNQLQSEWKEQSSVSLSDYSYWVYWAYVRFVLTDQLVIELQWAYQLLALSIELGENRLQDAVMHYIACQHRITVEPGSMQQKPQVEVTDSALPFYFNQTESIVYWPLLRSLPTHFLNNLHNFLVYESGNCALLLTNDDRMYALGVNGWGQLGVGHTVDLTRPGEIDEMRDKDIEEITFGPSYVMALTSDGDLYGWGCNNYGQVGSGAKLKQPQPVLVKQTVKNVRCGLNHTMAIDTEGTVWCWGSNEHGQLGREGKENQVVPVRVKGLPPVQSVECGQHNSMALTTQAQVYVWGHFSLNTMPQIHYTPTLITLHAVAITSVTCADFVILSKDRTVHRCFYDQNETLQMEPIKVDEPVRAVVWKYWESLVFLVTWSGRIVVWHRSGSITNTSLTSLPDAVILYGHYPITHSLTTLPPSAIEPQLLRSIEYFHNRSQFDLTLTFKCKDCEINLYKFIYLCTPQVVHKSKYLKSKIEGDWRGKHEVLIEVYPFYVYWAYLRYVLCDVFEVEADWVSKLLQLATEYNEYRLREKCLEYLTPCHRVQLCQPNHNSHSSTHFNKDSCQNSHENVHKYLKHLTQDSILLPIAQKHFLSPNEESIFVLTHRNELYAMGKNDNGQLGIGHQIDPSKFSLVQGFGNRLEIKQIEWGQHHVVALRANHEIYAWGRNNHGQVNGCKGTVEKRAIFVGSYIKSVRCGHNHTCIINMRSEIWSWGNNNYGQLGQNTREPLSNPQQIHGLDQVEQIECGPNNTMARTKTGQLYVWGQFEPAAITFAKQVELLPEVAITSMVPSRDQFLLLDTYGRVYCGRFDRSSTCHLDLLRLVSNTPVQSIKPCNDILYFVQSNRKVVFWDSQTQISFTELENAIQGMLASVSRSAVSRVVQQGICYILNYDNFDDKSLNRGGSHYDVEALTKTFGNFLHFRVQTQNNLTFGETEKFLDYASNYNYSSYDLFTFCLLSHGNENEFHCRDKKMDTNRIYATFQQSANSLKSTHKLFVISKCLGKRTNYGVRVPIEMDSEYTNHSYVPDHSDTLIFYSTYPGYVSYRSPSGGTFFIQTLCQAIQLLCSDRQCNLLDLCTMVTRVTNELCMQRGMVCQQATCVSTLRNHILLGPGSGSTLHEKPTPLPRHLTMEDEAHEHEEDQLSKPSKPEVVQSTLIAKLKLKSQTFIWLKYFIPGLLVGFLIKSFSKR